MKNLNRAGKILITIGVLVLFKRDYGSYTCFAGYVDNTKEILFISMLIISIGAAMIFFSKRKMHNAEDLKMKK